MAQGDRVTSPSIWNEEGGIAGEERDDVIEQADLRLVQEGPEVPDDRRREHHRQEDDRGPHPVSAELLVDSQASAKPSTVWIRIVAITNRAVTCMAAQTSGSVRMSL